jgi:hypothetical protein
VPMRQMLLLDMCCSACSVLCLSQAPTPLPGGVWALTLHTTGDVELSRRATAAASASMPIKLVLAVCVVWR